MPPDRVYTPEDDFELDAAEIASLQTGTGSMFDISDYLFEATREAKLEEEERRLPTN